MMYTYGVIGVEGDKKLHDQLQGGVIAFGDSNLFPFPIYSIKFKDLCAIVSDVPEQEFSQAAIDKNFKDMQWLSQNAPKHELVVDFVRGKTTIVPMKFCTIFKSKEKVVKLLEEKYADLKENLERLHGKVEMGVKLYADFESMKTKINSSEIEKLELEKRTKTPGMAYFVQQKIDTLIKDKANAIVNDATKSIFSTYHYAIDFRKNHLIKEKDLVLNSVFLINKVDVEKFNQDVGSIRGNFPALGVKTIGPFTPYNFVK
jgi:hypothetical protein